MQPKIVAETKDERQREPADNLVTTLDKVAQRQPNDTAVVSLHQKDHLGVGALRWTYSQLRDGSVRLAHRLAAAGIRKGSRIATFLYNEIEWTLLFLASARLGSHFVPLDPRLLDTPSEAVYLLRKIWAEVIFVSNLTMAESLEEILNKELMPQVLLKGIVAPVTAGHKPEALPRGWRRLSAIMDGPDPSGIVLNKLNRHDTILMLATSGTTSRPKICPHTSVTIVTPALGLADNWSLTREDIICQHLPSFHVFNIAMNLAFWVAGGTVVIPSPEFNPAATFEGLTFGSRVWIAAVTTMIHAMHTYSMVTEEDLASPYGICLGGGPITPQALRECRLLGASKIVAGYGTTEGVATLYNVMDVNDPRVTDVQDGDEICLGSAMAGSHLRICAPGSRTPLHRNEIGELHQGGYPIFDGYYQGSEEDNAACYKEGTVPWFATGDRGYMDHDGNIYLLGRFKDLIIRAGENISPLKIEQCLAGQPGVASVVVVGAPDDIVDEVPVAVIETFHPEDRSFFLGLQSVVVREMGRSFSPKCILHLQHDLGREKYPTTTSGKIKKNVVKEWVADHLRGSTTQVSSRTQTPSISESSTVLTTPSITSATKDDITGQLTACWSSVSGFDPLDIKPDMPIRTFTDSTMLIQFVHLAKHRGWKLTLKELLTANTIEKQAQLLSGTKSTPPSPPAPTESETTTMMAIKKKRAAVQLGLHVDDIEELVPMTDLFRMLAVDRPFPGVWDFRICFSVRRDLSPDKVALILGTWLRRHELLRSVVATIGDETPVYAVMQPKESWLRQQIIFGPEVDGLHRVADHQLDDFVDSSYGPLCKMTILPLRHTSRCGIIMHIHHVLFDGMVMERWIRDINHLFDGQSQLNWYPYREFAANYEAYRSTIDAEESIQYFVNKLSGIASAKDAVWDIHRVLQKLDKNYSPPTNPGNHVTPARANPDTLPKRFTHLPELPQMRSRFGISAPIIALAACALINVRYTGACEAIITNLQSGRSWPTEDGPSDVNVSVLEIDGPTLQNLPARIPVAPEDSVLDLLNRVRKEQDEMMLREHVPVKRVHDLVSQGLNGAEDAAVLWDLLTNQLFDWLLEPYRHCANDALELLRDTSLSRPSWVWLPRLSDGNVMHCNIYHADADLPVDKTNFIVEEYLCAVAWLADPANAQEPVSACRFEGYMVGFADFMVRSSVSGSQLLVPEAWGAWDLRQYSRSFEGRSVSPIFNGVLDSVWEKPVTL
ncbi:nonribosomal peptide synthase [Aspergillus pseudoviridinutans]|uniref:Nonribosomal peptide synthase n=1 Tax=Aspergillus pseudoviridinutans TaxID=1517512 RepID=A0A9P3BH50_9EURO|nr:nonribosomal peptide synthase [Aspergillus pseudoviridinutans]GIJ91186.1 nonribosomal peptide synthase [Aspergillus pseudoviridinutans]